MGKIFVVVIINNVINIIINKNQNEHGFAAFVTKSAKDVSGGKRRARVQMLTYSQGSFLLTAISIFGLSFGYVVKKM